MKKQKFCVQVVETMVKTIMVEAMTEEAAKRIARIRQKWHGNNGFEIEPMLTTMVAYEVNEEVRV